MWVYSKIFGLSCSKYLSRKWVLWALLASLMTDETPENVFREWVLWALLASLMADETPENVFREWVCSGFFWQLGGLMSLLKICPECECVLASFGKLDGSWASFWKCVQRVSVFWLLLASCMTDEAASENVSSMWVCSGFFWQAAWLMRLLLKMCPDCECVLASSSKLHG